MINSGVAEAPSALPADVEHAQGSEVPDCSERTIGCLKTAAWLLDQTVGEGDDRGLCVADSATYNPLREALNAVVKGRDPAEGGLPPIRDAWEKLQLAPLGTDVELGVRRRSVYVLASVMADRERSSERARQLLGYLRDQSGAEPPQAGQYIGSYASSKLANASFVPSSAALNPAGFQYSATGADLRL